MARIRWTPQSVNDIEQIAEYIAKDSRVYASIQTERFFEAVKILEVQISAGRIVPEIGDDSIREIIIGYYRIIYRVVNDPDGPPTGAKKRPDDFYWVQKIMFETVKIYSYFYHVIIFSCKISAVFII